MAKYLYLEGASGISGDMTVAALLDLGGSREKLNALFADLHSLGLHYALERKNSYSISGLDFQVFVHGKDADHTEHHEESYHENHEHHNHESHGHHEHHRHAHRHLAEVFEIVDQAKLTPRAKNLAHRIFEIIAEAEAKAHGVSKEEVHFHEVGALDSIADILAVSVLMDDLGIENTVVESLHEGSGEVLTQHGALPVPVPAVANIAATYGIALQKTSVKGEMVTPTGIAIAAALRTKKRLPEIYQIEKIGIGLGKWDFGKANFLRAMILNDEANSSEKKNAEEKYIQILEANIDDSTPEELGFAMEKLFTAGAADVNFIPCQMKKNRPGVLLKAIVPEGEKAENVADAIFRYTTTIGVRQYAARRICMERKIQEVPTKYGILQVKKCSWKDIVRFYPEYESVCEAQQKNSAATFREIFDEARRIAETSFTEGTTD